MRYKYCVAGNVNDLEILLSYIKSLHREDHCYRLGIDAIIMNNDVGDIELLQLGSLDEACVFFKVESNENFQINKQPFFKFYHEICEAKYCENKVKYCLYRFSGINSQKDNINKSIYKDQYLKYFEMGPDRRLEANNYEVERTLASIDSIEV